MDKNRVIVTVHGRQYTLVGTEPVDYLRRVAGYVDSRMGEIAQASYLPEDRLMALTALNLADELFKSRDEVNALRRELTQLRREQSPEGEALKKEKPDGE